MCSRFALTAKPTVLQAAFDLGHVPGQLAPSEHYHPGGGIPAVVNAVTRDVEILYWGLIPSWAKDISIAKHTFNARAETLEEKASFKTAFLRRRCLIPASAYFEWKQVTVPVAAPVQLSLDGTAASPEARYKTYPKPYRFSLKAASCFMFAGLWEYWVDASGNEVYSGTVITCPAVGGMEDYHPRMPVILTRENCWQWMEDRPFSELHQLLQGLGTEYFKIEEA